MIRFLRKMYRGVRIQNGQPIIEELAESVLYRFMRCIEQFHGDTEIRSARSPVCSISADDVDSKTGAPSLACDDGVFCIAQFVHTVLKKPIEKNSGKLNFSFALFCFVLPSSSVAMIQHLQLGAAMQLHACIHQITDDT